MQALEGMMNYVPRELQEAMKLLQRLLKHARVLPAKKQFIHSHCFHTKLINKIVQIKSKIKGHRTKHQRNTDFDKQNKTK
jgi:hypothetical protein